MSELESACVRDVSETETADVAVTMAVRRTVTAWVAMSGTSSETLGRGGVEYSHCEHDHE